MAETAPIPYELVITDVMPEGFAIQKDPTPIARIAMVVPGSEYGIPDVVETDTALSDEEKQELAGLMESGGVITPAAEDVAGPASETEPEPDAEPEADVQESGQGFFKTLRRSRLGRAVAITALAAGELLSFGTAHAQATDNQVEQECVQAGLAAPQIIHYPYMGHAGIRPFNAKGKRVGGQYVKGEFEYEAMSPPTLSVDCTSDYLRLAGGKTFMERPNVHGNPGNPIKRPKDWVPIDGLSKGLGAVSWYGFGVIGDQAGRARLYWNADFNKPTYVFNRCVDGKFRKVDFVERNVVKDSQTRQTLGKAYHVLNMPVHGNCRAAERSSHVPANAG